MLFKYRMLTDGLICLLSGASRYGRKANYYYFPIGFKISTALEKWSMHNET